MEQTYPDRELLIVADGDDVRDLVPADERIRLVHLEEQRTIGEKRNVAASIAEGDILIHWDDDDHSAPGRMADQVERLIASGKAVTGYDSMTFQDVRDSSWWTYRGPVGYALGTSLCYWKPFWRDHPFPAIQIGEDNRFVQAAALESQLSTVPAGDRMWASIHSGNTSPRQLLQGGENWKRLPEFAGISQ